jgi:hypothetical protein
MKKGTIITLSIIVSFFVILFLGVVSFYGYTNKLRTQNIGFETTLSAQYLSNQNYLSEYVSGFYETLGVANIKSDKMDKILTDAVKGRYGEKGFSSDGAFFSAIKEAYPDITGLNIYDKIIDYVKSRRAGYRDIQDKLLDMLATYDRWRKEGWVQSYIVANVIGAPTEDLKARVGTEITTGKAALDKMYQIVLTEQAVDAYSTGKMAPLQIK